MIACPACGNQNAAGARFCAECGTKLVSAAPASVRKIVSVLFCDLVGSTALGERLDPESTQAVLDRYFAAVRAAIERHGGLVEKYIGDAVMAVFGLPTAHEDDAIRAARAALEIRDALIELNQELAVRFEVELANRTGVATGEVVAGDPSTGQRLVTGDTVNAAARLEQAAGAGETLVDDATWQLARRSVRAEQLPPLTVKGKEEPMTVHRLLGLGDASYESQRSQFVGRDPELASLLRRLNEILTRRRLGLVTVSGEAGVGKSRLVTEFVDRIGDRARIHRTGCLSYGEGITYWPLAQLVRATAGIDEQDSVADARGKIGRVIDARTANAISALIGLGGDVSTDQATVAINGLLVGLARDRPLVWVVEDIHWAEAALLDCIERADSGSAVFILATARPDLLDKRPSWPIDIALAELSTEALTMILAGARLPPHIEQRVRAAAGGNPLFAEQMAAFINEHPGETALPPSLAALLTARVDGLPADARALAQRAAVEGDVFHVAAILALTDGNDPGAAIAGLLARRIIRPANSQFTAEPAYVFSHTLLREAAYTMLPKRARAEAHEQVANWLIGKAGDRLAEYEEVIGYQLEQSYSAYAAIERPDERVLGIARQAGERLAAAGRRAERRDDMAAAHNLLGRALTLLAAGHGDRPSVLSSLARVEHNRGLVDRADDLYSQAIDEAVAVGATGIETAARLALVTVRFDRALASAHEVLAEAEHAYLVLGRGEDRRLARNVAFSLVYARNNVGDATGAMAAAQELLTEVTAAGEDILASAAAERVAWALAYGPTPASAAAARIGDLLSTYPGPPFPQTICLRCLAVSQAMAGDIDAARSTIAAATEIASKSGLAYLGAFMQWSSGQIERMAGDDRAAERLMRQACSWYDSMGIAGVFSTVAAELADVLCDLGALEEALELTERSRAATVAGDVLSEVGWRRVRARVLVRLDRLDDTEALASEAVAIAEETDFLDLRTDAWVAQAEVLAAIGRPGQAALELRKALELAEAKGNVIRVLKLSQSTLRAGSAGQRQ